MGEGFIENVYGSYANEADEVERVRIFDRFTPASLSGDVVRDKPNRCSVTAMATAFFHDLKLIRGYALFDRQEELQDPAASPVWIGHWWAVTEDGHVVDASWTKPGIAYIGERIEVRKVEEGIAAYTLDGELITDLGVFMYPPPQVVQALELKRAA
ncbi:MAG: hypothetical protein ACKVUT_00515 [Gaiella sp.]